MSRNDRVESYFWKSKALNYCLKEVPNSQKRIYGQSGADLGFSRWGADFQKKFRKFC